MTWYAFIHPLLAVGTTVLGLITAQTSLSKMNDWDFPLRKQRSRTVIFFLLCVANFGIGLFVNIALAGLHKGIKLTAHLPLSIVVLTITFLAALVTFTRGKPGEVSPLMRYHSVLTTLALALVLTMGFLGLIQLF
jgi:hypothetical protein